MPRNRERRASAVLQNQQRMERIILTKGEGFITKVTVCSKNGCEGFTGKGNKRAFIQLLKEAQNRSVVLVAYYVSNTNAHFILKTTEKSDVGSYVNFVIEQYEYYHNNRVRPQPLRTDYVEQRIKSEDLGKAVAYVHSLADSNPATNEFCSYSYLKEGIYGGTAVIIAENGGSMTLDEFEIWLQTKAGGNYRLPRTGLERFNTVLRECKRRYLSGPNVSEEAIIYTIAELCERCGAKYKKAARAVGISFKERRDILIAVLRILMKRGKDFDTARRIMAIEKLNRGQLLMDCVLQESRVNQYSYDHIINAFGIDDFYYDKLAKIMKKLHRLYNYTFEELCVKFHLQYDILALRSKCGF